MATKNENETNTTTEAPRKRGVRPAKETGRVSITLGPELYAALDARRWDERRESVADLAEHIVADWAGVPLP